MMILNNYVQNNRNAVDKIKANRYFYLCAYSSYSMVTILINMKVL